MNETETNIKDIKAESSVSRALKKEKWVRAKKMKMLYLFFSIPVILYIVFHYMPMYGVIIAFKKYRIADGILGSQWNNFEHFKMLFGSLFFMRIMRNTLLISFYRLIFGFPAPIILALLLNEVGNMPFKRITQSISYLPHFMSWVVLAGIMIEVLSPQRGIVGYIYTLLGREAPNLLINKRLFRPMLILTGIWKDVGWGTVMDLAAFSSIDPGLYESAAIDGATRFQRAIFITIPSIIPVITILFILSLGAILNAGFDQIFNLYTPLVYEVADIIDTYVYRVGLIERKYDFSTAVGLFKNVIGVMLLLGTNAVIKRFSEYGIW
jgi:putative aldouronate transport system permease protein